MGQTDRQTDSDVVWRGVVLGRVRCGEVGEGVVKREGRGYEGKGRIV